MPTSISGYVLTQDSERRLAQVLAPLRRIADEIVVVDSGSRDATLDIARAHEARLLTRAFDNFRDQRMYAESQCTHPWILQLDSDEVMSEELADAIAQRKRNDFAAMDQGPPPDGYCMTREWYVLGRRVHAFYPVRTPDSVIRLYRRDRIGHGDSRIVHESLSGPERKIARLPGVIQHYTCDSVDQLYAKINLYTSLSAQDMHMRGEHSSAVKRHLYPWLVWLRWYALSGGWKDGDVGLLHARYVRDTVALKYRKLQHDFDARRP